MNDIIRIGRQQRVFFEAILNRVAFNNAERLQFIEFHPLWVQKGYESGQYVRWPNADGVTELWRASRQVPTNAPAPDVPTNPSNWAKV